MCQRVRGAVLRHRSNIDAHANRMLTAAYEHALNRADIAVVAAERDRNMRITNEAIVGGIEVDPAQRPAPA